MTNKVESSRQSKDYSGIVKNTMRAGVATVVGGLAALGVNAAGGAKETALLIARNTPYLNGGSSAADLSVTVDDLKTELDGTKKNKKIQIDQLNQAFTNPSIREELQALLGIVLPEKYDEKLLDELFYTKMSLEEARKVGQNNPINFSHRTHDVEKLLATEVLISNKLMEKLVSITLPFTTQDFLINKSDLLSYINQVVAGETMSDRVYDKDEIKFLEKIKDQIEASPEGALGIKSLIQITYPKKDIRPEFDLASKAVSYEIDSIQRGVAFIGDFFPRAAKAAYKEASPRGQLSMLSR